MKRRLAVRIIPILAMLLFSVWTTWSTAEDKCIQEQDAKDYIGEVKAVCGKVVSTKWASGSKGSPTFLNLERPYPNQIFTVVIWGGDRSKFKKPPEEFFRNKEVQVTGKITEYREKPQIIVDDPAQIKVLSD